MSSLEPAAPALASRWCLNVRGTQARWPSWAVPFMPFLPTWTWLPTPPFCGGTFHLNFPSAYPGQRHKYVSDMSLLQKERCQVGRPGM